MIPPKRLYALIIASAAIFASTAAVQSADAPAKESDRTDWFREAKFGMFIHWGLYAIPARGEHYMSKAKIPVAKYAELAGQFNPVKFNAAEWVRIAKDAGMKYIVITAKHHDGFAMFGSKTSPYNIVDATPFRRDPLKELAAACAQENIRLGFYYSHAQDWHHPGGASGKSWDPAQKGDFDEYLRTVSIPQIKELLTGYGPTALIWCDTPFQMTPERGRRIVAAIRETRPETLVNSRLMYHGREVDGKSAADLNELKQIGVDYLSYRDREIPAHGAWRDWESCMTLNQSWGYTQGDNNWKSPATIVAQLVEIASKGGNFLLNVGPTAEGVIPEASVNNLKVVGKWLAVNGEAIYGAGPSRLTAPDKSDKPARRTGKAGTAPHAWWCTTRPGQLYTHIFTWPAGPLVLDGVQGRVTKAYLLSAREKALQFTQADNHLSVQLPAGPPDSIASVLCLELQEGGKAEGAPHAATRIVEIPTIQDTKPIDRQL